MRLLIIIISVLICSCQNKNRHIEKYPSGKPKIIGQFGSKGEKKGRWIHYSEVGQISEVHYYRNDSICSIEHYNNDTLVIVRDEYKNGVKHGKSESFYVETGMRKSISYFVNGKKNGQVNVFYENGNPQQSYYLVEEDSIAGEFRNYYENGQLQIYVEKVEVGTMHVYDSLGNKTFEFSQENLEIIDTLKVYSPTERRIKKH